MFVELLNNEKLKFEKKIDNTEMTVQEINEKYEKGYNRIVTEQGSFKLSSIKDLFSNKENYILNPDYQRRPLIWNKEKKSKLIESFIMNVPIPPIFLYEKEFDKYEIMDGLQRISSIISFYKDEFELTGLEEWSELNGYRYSTLPKTIREGIDRRQLSSVTLLKESSNESLKAMKIRKTVFERLNTGGEILEPQEIRNALYNGSLNRLCIKLSENKIFRDLWNIKSINKTENIDIFEYIEASDTEQDDYKNNKLYSRMGDVELVLRFFAIRQLENYKNSMHSFLDNFLVLANEQFDESILKDLETIFESTMFICSKLFGDKAFCQFKNNNWSKPQRASFDPICLSIYKYLDELQSIINKTDLNRNLNILKNTYIENKDLFNSKNQSKNDILRRAGVFDKLILKIIQEDSNNV